MNEMITVFIVTGAALTAVCFYEYFVWRRPKLSLIVSTILFLALYAVTVVENPWYDVDEIMDVTLTLVTAFLLLTIVVLHWAPTNDLESRPAYKQVTGIILTVVGAGAALAAMGFLFNVFGLVFMIIIIVAFCQLQRTLRKSRIYEIVSALNLIVTQNLPLAMGLDTAAYRQGRINSRIFQKTARLIAQGYPLHMALRIAYPKLPADIVAEIKAAEEVNQLPQMLETITNEQAENLHQNSQVRPVLVFYPVLVFLFAMMIVWGLMIFIVPTFVEVIQDISDGDMGLFGPLQVLKDMTSLLINPEGFAVTAAVIIIGFMIFAYTRRRPRRPEKPRLLSCLGDTVKWHIPLWRWFERQYSAILTVGVLRAGLRSGHPLPRVVESCLYQDVNWWYKKRLRKLHRLIEQGQNVSSSIRAAGLGRTLAWSFDEKINRGRSADILSMLHDAWRGMYHYRMNLFHSIAWPITIVLLGCVVGYIVYALYGSMIHLLETVMKSWMP